jgi:hypothetical protein
MDKDSNNLWLTIAQVLHEGKGYRKVFDIKLSGMSNIRDFLKNFLLVEKEAIEAREDFAYLPSEGKNRVLEATTGTPSFYIYDYDAKPGDTACITSIKKFLDHYT